MSAWYNEIDPQKAAWLRELIREGHIADGVVDETSIERIRPVDIASFTQCHFFAGIGVWSHALRVAGWSDDTPVWTGSCPCQGFSASGKREGFSDKRHLWPVWFRLIRELRPQRIFGEQVASNDGLAWFDIVSSDMEGEGYAIGACDTCAAGFGAPHIRQRLYFVAHAGSGRAHERRRNDSEVPRVPGEERTPHRADVSGSCGISGLVAQSGSQRLQGERLHIRERGSRERVPETDRRGSAGLVADAAEFGRIGRRPGEAGGEPGALERPERLRDAGGMAHASCDRRQHEPTLREIDGEGMEPAESRREPRVDGEHSERPGPVNGCWRDADWILCTDGKWRPVRSGSFPLAHGSPARVGRLRGYGDGIVAPQAAAFIRAYREISRGD